MRLGQTRLPPCLSTIVRAQDASALGTSIHNVGVCGVSREATDILIGEAYLDRPWPIHLLRTGTCNAASDGCEQNCLGHGDGSYG